MFSKRIALSMLVAAIAATPATRAAADFADGLVGGLVGGAVSGIIVNESAKARERRRSAPQRVYRAPVNTVARQQVIEEQTALNYFGFPAGTPDGVRGRNTRNAASQFQAHMGYPITGNLTEYERQFLVSSYYRAQSNPAMTAQLVAQRGMGPRGILHAYRDEAAGMTAGTTGSGSVMVSKPAQTEQSTDTGSGATMAALPNLMGDGGDGPSLASHCNQVSLVTSSNGGFVTAASLGDPRFALNEQFCLARTYAISSGEAAAANLSGVSNAQLEEQCGAIGPAMRDYVAALSLEPRDGVIDEVRGFVRDSGQAPAQLSGTAKICLSVGYRTDKMDVALGSALLLAGLGEDAYSELIGHHLNEGFGTTRRPDLAVAWYEAGIAAVERSGEPVFAPGSPERTDLIRKAVFTGQSSGAQQGTESVKPAATLPSFGSSD
ncbi:MAG: peptidoglycan-binding protein [Roseovarius sp.]|nr:peptidoglycan-binding protein [Roseovarius sp.]